MPVGYPRAGCGVAFGKLCSKTAGIWCGKSVVGQHWEGLGHRASNPTEHRGEAEGAVPCFQMGMGLQYGWEGPEELGKVLRSSGRAAGGVGVCVS